jgi:hypothetical protein
VPTLVAALIKNNPAGSFTGLNEHAFFDQRLFAVEFST